MPGLPNVYAVGDTALALAWKGQPVPGLAPAAKQGGAYVAQAIRARVEGRAAARVHSPTPTWAVWPRSGARPRSPISAGSRFWGAPAWWLWGAVHVGFLVGVRNRMSVMFDWFWAYLTYRGGTRLITGGSAAMRGTQQAMSR